MLSPKVYRTAARVAFGCIYLAATLGIVVVWIDIGNPELISKLFITLAIAFFAATMTMAFASVSRRDSLAGKHKSFRLTVADSDQEKGDR